MRPFRKAKKALGKVKVTTRTLWLFLCMETSKGSCFLHYCFLHLCSCLYWLNLVIWGSSGTRGYLCSHSTREMESSLYHPQSRRGFRSSFSLSSSHASGSAPYLWLISLSLHNWGSRTCLDCSWFPVPRQKKKKKKVVTCRYNVLLEMMSQWTGTFGLFITLSPFPLSLPVCRSVDCPPSCAIPPALTEWSCHSVHVQPGFPWAVPVWDVWQSAALPLSATWKPKLSYLPKVQLYWENAGTGSHFC